MYFNILFALPLIAGALAAPAEDVALVTRDHSKHKFEVTTWSGTNCRGSSEVGYLEVSGSHCFNVPGGSFSGLKTNKNRLGASCAIHPYSGRDCKGSSPGAYSAQNNNLCYENHHFASYKLDCCNQAPCSP